MYVLSVYLSKHMKRCSTSYAIGNCKLKQYHIHILIWKKTRTLKIPNSDEDVEQWELSLLLMEVQNVMVTLEDSLIISHKSKHTFTI